VGGERPYEHGKPSLVTTHHSPLTTHHAPLTTHHSPLTKPRPSHPRGGASLRQLHLGVLDVPVDLGRGQRLLVLRDRLLRLAGLQEDVAQPAVPEVPQPPGAGLRGGSGRLLRGGYGLRLLPGLQPRRRGLLQVPGLQLRVVWGEPLVQLGPLLEPLGLPTLYSRRCSVGSLMSRGRLLKRKKGREKGDAAPDAFSLPFFSPRSGQS
jgi:hypothetical protein